VRLFLLLILAVSTTSLYCQDKGDTTETRINILVNKFNKGTLNAQEAKEIKELTYKIQNKGFTLEEKDHDYQNSLVYIEKALNIWIAIHDTANEANNRKYKGLLLGYLNRFPEAKKEIQTAIYLFASVQRYYGIAVSQFDLAKVFESEGLMDSAFYYANAALAYWKNANDTSRIVICTNYKLHLFYKTNELTRADQLQKQSEALVFKKDLYWQDYIDYFYLSKQICEKLNHKKMAKKYKLLYDQKVELLKKQNIVAKSAYL